MLGLLIIATFFADRVIFRPPAASYQDDADVIKLKPAIGETIAARYYANQQAEYTILFSHGNAEDVGLIEPFIRRLRDAGFNVLTYDYRGYGTSSGSPSEANSYEDIAAAYNYLLTEKGIKPENIILQGRSLGGAVAIDLAAREKVGGLIVESTFTTAFRVVTRYPIIPFDRFDSIRKIEKVPCPVLVMHGTSDWTIPVYHGKRLFEAANEPKYAVWVDGAGHNDLFYRVQSRYLNAVVEFSLALKAQ